MSPTQRSKLRSLQTNTEQTLTRLTGQRNKGDTGMTSAERKRILKRAKRKARDKQYQAGHWQSPAMKQVIPPGQPLRDEVLISL